MGEGRSDIVRVRMKVVGGGCGACFDLPVAGGVKTVGG